MDKLLAILIYMLSLSLSSSAFGQQTPVDAMILAEEYANETWVAGDDGWYIDVDHPENNHKVFTEDVQYTGVAYWYGGWDTIDQFQDKMSSGEYAPREEAGIDCSGLVSRCWDLSYKRNVSQLIDMSVAMYRQHADIAEVLARLSPTPHIVIITGYEGIEDNDVITFIEAYGYPPDVHKVRERQETWTTMENQYNLYCYQEWAGIGVPDPCMTWSPDPSPLDSAVSGNGQVTLYWDYAPGHNDDTMYRVFWGTSPGNYTQSSEQIDAYGYYVTGLNPYTTYYFAVKVGLDGYGWSDYSNELNAVPYGAPWIVSGNTTISNNRTIHGDIVIQNGATLTISPSTVLTFDNSQEGTNYGGRSTECEVVIQNGGTLNVGSSATLTSLGDWGGVYMLDGGNIDLTSGSAIENAIIGIHMFGHDIISGQDASNKAYITNCSTGIRMTDTTANIHYIEFSGCGDAISAVGIPTTPVMYNVNVPSGGTGLTSVDYAIPRLYYSEISSSITGHSIAMTQSGNLDIDGEHNNIYDPVSNYAIYISSTCPDISVMYNYWGSSLPVASDLFSLNYS